jgi:hypothetical protein
MFWLASSAQDIEQQGNDRQVTRDESHLECKDRLKIAVMPRKKSSAPAG